jgi:hypothetical protein
MQKESSLIGSFSVAISTHGDIFPMVAMGIFSL